jgi:hypothetical protein
MRPTSRALALIALAGAALACDRPADAPRGESAVATPAPVVVDSAPPAPAGAPWDVGVGPALVVHDATSDAAFVVAPGSGEGEVADLLEGATIDLIAPGGAAGRAVVTGTTAREPAAAACASWTSADLRPDPDARVGEWTVAFVAGHVTPLPLRPIEVLPAADSARLAAEMTRLASALPDSGRSPFRGIPFVVRTAYRFSPAPGVAAVVADLVRKLPQEATPLEEHTLIVAERDSAATDARLRPGYWDRASGSEERVVSAEVLAAVASGSRARLVIARVGYEATAYAVIERDGGGRWRLRWTSAAGC